MASFRPTPDSNCNVGGFIRPTEKPVGHSPCSTLPDHVTMSRQERFTREQVLQQLFSQQPFSEPEEDAKKPDREANGQGDGEADRDDDDEDEDYDEDEDPVGDASTDSSSLEEEEEEEEGQDHGTTTITTTGLVEREHGPRGRTARRSAAASPPPLPPPLLQLKAGSPRAPQVTRRPASVT